MAVHVDKLAESVELGLPHHHPTVGVDQHHASHSVMLGRESRAVQGTALHGSER